MPYKDKQKNREYQREWSRRKRLGLPTRTTVPLSDDERKKRHRTYQKEYRIQKRREAVKLLGNQCFICGSKKSLACHNKLGTPHHTSQTYVLVVKNPERFVRLCRKCHNGIHWVMERFNMTWEEIIERVDMNGI